MGYRYCYFQFTRVNQRDTDELFVEQTKKTKTVNCTARARRKTEKEKVSISWPLKPI